MAGPELEGGLVKAGWRAHHHDPKDQGLQWPYLPPSFPLPAHLFTEEVDIWCCTWDAEHKSRNCFCQSGYRVLEMPPLWLVLMPQKMMKEEEEAFWYGLDVEMREELELGLPPPNVQLAKVGQRILWRAELEPAQEGPPL